MRFENSSSYLAIDGTFRDARIKWAIEVLRPLSLGFDSIAFTGVSGALVAPTIAHMMSKDILVARKGERRHSRLVVEGVCKSRYIVIDDMIFSGNTIRTIIKKIKVASGGNVTCVGVYTYVSGEFHDELYVRCHFGDTK